MHLNETIPRFPNHSISVSKSGICRPSRPNSSSSLLCTPHDILIVNSVNITVLRHDDLQSKRTSLRKRIWRTSRHSLGPPKQSIRDIAAVAWGCPLTSEIAVGVGRARVVKASSPIIRCSLVLSRFPITPRLFEALLQSVALGRPSDSVFDHLENIFFWTWP